MLFSTPSPTQVGSMAMESEDTNRTLAGCIRAQMPDASGICSA